MCHQYIIAIGDGTELGLCFSCFLFNKPMLNTVFHLSTINCKSVNVSCVFVISVLLLFTYIPQIAFRRRTDVGYWSHGRQILPTLGRRWLANQHSGIDVSIFCRRWADVGLPTNTQVRCLYFANVGPTADFYSRWR